MNFSAWFERWLTRHPLKDPPRYPRYTTEVMERVRATAHTSMKAPVLTGILRWWSSPQFSLAAVTVATGIALMIGSTRISNHLLPEEVSREFQLLAAVAPDEVGPMIGNDVNALAQELEAVDTLVLAEAHKNAEDQWLDQTLQLLDQLDDDEIKVGTPGDSETSNEEWLKELQLLDESDVTTT